MWGVEDFKVSVRARCAAEKTVQEIIRCPILSDYYKQIHIYGILLLLLRAIFPWILSVSITISLN